MYVNSDYRRCSEQRRIDDIPAVCHESGSERHTYRVRQPFLVPQQRTPSVCIMGRAKTADSDDRPEIGRPGLHLVEQQRWGDLSLSICKEIQFLNVLCGGDLYQDIYTETTILHLQSLGRCHCITMSRVKREPSVKSSRGKGTMR